MRRGWEGLQLIRYDVGRYPSGRTLGYPVQVELSSVELSVHHHFT